MPQKCLNCLGNIGNKYLRIHVIFLRWKDGPMRYPECQITDVEREAVGWLRFSRANEWPVYLTLDAAGRLARPPISCMDCRTRGGYLNKPAFWID